MTQSVAITKVSHHSIEEEKYFKTVFGFWIYLLTDFMMFAVLFATFAVLHKSTMGGPSVEKLFGFLFLFIQTSILLVSSFTVGLGGVFALKKEKGLSIAFFTLTLLLGIGFFGMQYFKFSELVHTGNSWQASAYLSAYFTLVGTHFIHVLFGLMWIVILLIQATLEGLSAAVVRRFICLKMFWQFLNMIWIFIFTVVYLMGMN